MSDGPKWAQEMRVDKNNRYLCTATNRSGNDCMAPAVKGAKVCRTHGGATPQVKRRAQLRLAELVAPAIAVLAEEMQSAEKSSDRINAANSILDRAGYARVTKIEGSEAREQLAERLLQMQREREIENQGELEELVIEGEGQS